MDKKFSLFNLWLYFICLYASFFLFCVGFLGSVREGGMFIVMLVLGTLGLLGTAVYIAMTLYGLWKFVIDESLKGGLKPSIGSPGAAVGKLFIPFYNFYWIFVCFRGLPLDLTALAAKRGLSVKLSAGLATSLCVVTLVGCIPYVNFLISPITTLILFPVYLFKVINFARNLKVYEMTGRDLFAAGSVTRQKMASIRDYGALFAQSRTDYTVVGAAFFLGMMMSGLVSSYLPFIMFMGIWTLTGMAVLLSFMFVFLSRRLNQVYMLIGGWALVYGLVIAVVRVMTGRYYGYHWGQFGWLFAGSFIYGLFFMGLLQLLIRSRGVRWWVLFLAYFGAFFLSTAGGALFGRYRLGLVGAGLINSLLGYGIMSAAVYAGLYFNVRLRVEESLLKE